jgi:bifunctional UDP-N-acetylglucosamine pyrophosphorylase/glucosamine-1-phosphate N-acetyltransferase
MQALILAAGRGERLRPLTETRPKVMLPVANKPILQHNLEQLAGIPAIKEIIIVVGYKAETIKRHFGSGFGHAKIRYVTQAKQLGTGHAIRQAAKFLKDRFLVLMGDNLYSRGDIERCLKHDLSILVKPVENPGIFGVCKVSKGLLKDMVEKPKNPPSNLANAGLYVLDSRVFGHDQLLTKRGEYEIVDSIKELCKHAPFHAIEAKDFDYITYPWDLLRVNEAVLRKTGPVIDKSAKIGKETRIEGPVAIGPNVELKNCVIRAYTSIGAGSVIGNFVEIKSSIIFENTKVPHLSYVGDSLIGSGCNFGAGTKIANLRFDNKPVKMKVKGRLVDSGRRKLGCVMGDNVKTGINVSIMPGATIPPGSNINPGSVLK